MDGRNSKRQSDIGPPPSVVQLIGRKIIAPELPSTVVSRDRVELLVTRLIEHQRFVLICASAGAGKTTVAVQAAQRSGRPLAWLDIDVTDTATGRLLVYLEAALRKAVPELPSVTAPAFAGQLAHSEVAGLLADTVGDAPVLIVLDNVERLAGSPAALGVVEAFARYLPQNARLLLLSRIEPSFENSLGRAPWVAAVGEHDLALTVEEAAAALAQFGREGLDAGEAVRQTGGWMTGVLFEAWRSSDHVLGMGGDSDPLHGYLATEILNHLDEPDRDFLITTAVLAEVSEAAAQALGIADVAARLRSLAGCRVPVSWRGNREVMRCHPRFREFLLRMFTLRTPAEQNDIRRKHAALLYTQGHLEEAVEEYLRSGDAARARLIMAPVLEAVIERTDFPVAERWLAAAQADRHPSDLDLAAAQLLMAVAREDFSGGVELADSLHRVGLREALAKQSGRAAALMVWCYLHVGDRAGTEAVLDAAVLTHDVQAARYTMNLVRDDPASIDGIDPTGGPLDALIMRAHFDLGRLSKLTTTPSSPWAIQVGESWLAGALLSVGDVDRALELYHRLSTSPEQSVWLTGVLGPKLMMEVGETEMARQLLREGRDRIAATGSELFLTYRLLIEAEFHLSTSGSSGTAAARAVLEEIELSPAGSFAFVREQHQMLLGLAELLDGEAELARAVLEPAAAQMDKGQRLLCLPRAAVYLAEARWRCGEEEGADAAANLALDAASRQGGNHVLLRALEEFPDVLSRRIDLESTVDSRWHELGRSLLIRGVQFTDVFRASVHLIEFGQLTILLNGVEVDPGLSKSRELLAFLASRDDHEATKGQLLRELFDGRSDESSSSYLRQAIFRLRKAVPDILDPDAPSGVVRLGTGARVTSESQRVRALLSQSAGMLGERKLNAMLDALEIAERGEYVPGAHSEWVEGQRHQLQVLIEDARCEAAEVAFNLGRYRQADHLAELVLRSDRYNERAWRLRMRIADAHGDEQRVMRAFHSCQQAMRELGTEPAQATVTLMQALRH